MKPTFSIELFGDYSYVIHDKKDQERILRWYKLGEQKDKPTITFPVDKGGKPMKNKLDGELETELIDEDGIVLDNNEDFTCYIVNDSILINDLKNGIVKSISDVKKRSCGVLYRTVYAPKPKYDFGTYLMTQESNEFNYTEAVRVARGLISALVVADKHFDQYLRRIVVKHSQDHDEVMREINNMTEEEAEHALENWMSQERFL